MPLCAQGCVLEVGQVSCLKAAANTEQHVHCQGAASSKTIAINSSRWKSIGRKAVEGGMPPPFPPGKSAKATTQENSRLCSPLARLNLN